ncbi:MAG: thiamine phosphate synthase, partial [Phycisphaerales bacterium]
DCLQIREKDMDGQELLNRTREIIALARPRGVSVIVNDRTDIAMAADADGVHLGTGDLPIAEARRIVGSTLLIGASTHDLTEARAAVNAGADYCGVGAMFPTVIKPDRKPAGAAYLRAFVEHFPQVPHLAIGGITPENVHALVDAGVQGIAVSGCVCDSPQPGEVVRGLREALSGAVKERVGTTPD